MIRGMTGFGRSSREASGLRVTVELRTVNHRHRDVRLRVPRSLLEFESRLRQRIAGKLGRGRAEVGVFVERTEGEPLRVRLNRSAAEALVESARQLREDFGLPGELSVSDVLAFSESLEWRPEEGEHDKTIELVESVLDDALAAAGTMHRSEGKMIARDVAGRLDRLAEIRTRIAARADRLPEEMKQRLEQRIAEMLSPAHPLDAGRLEQEVALLIERADITEEVVRLAGFIDKAREVLDGDGGDAGKRLDFLAQEMNREVNTIGSKAADVGVGTDVVEAKLELDRIREQVQNLA